MNPNLKHTTLLKRIGTEWSRLIWSLWYVVCPFRQAYRVRNFSIGSFSEALIIEIFSDFQTMKNFVFWTPEGRPGMSDVSLLSGISGLSFDPIFLFPVLFFYVRLSLLCLVPFSAYGPFSWLFLKKIRRYLSLRKRLLFFCMAPVWQLGEVS